MLKVEEVDMKLKMAGKENRRINVIEGILILPL
jgi:hypothetical protein